MSITDPTASERLEGLAPLEHGPEPPRTGSWGQPRGHTAAHGGNADAALEGRHAARCTEVFSDGAQCDLPAGHSRAHYVRTAPVDQHALALRALTAHVRELEARLLELEERCITAETLGAHLVALILDERGREYRSLCSTGKAFTLAVQWAEHLIADDADVPAL